MVLRLRPVELPLTLLSVSEKTLAATTCTPDFIALYTCTRTSVENRLVLRLPFLWLAALASTASQLVHIRAGKTKQNFCQSNIKVTAHMEPTVISMPVTCNASCTASYNTSFPIVKTLGEGQLTLCCYSCNRMYSVVSVCIGEIWSCCLTKWFSRLTFADAPDPSSQSLPSGRRQMVMSSWSICQSDQGTF